MLTNFQSSPYLISVYFNGLFSIRVAKFDMPFSFVSLPTCFEGNISLIQGDEVIFIIHYFFIFIFYEVIFNVFSNACMF